MAAMRYPMPSVLSPVIDLKSGKLTTAWVNYLKGLEEVASRFSGGAEGQIAFPATQSPSTDANTLDDYEEGSWTPVFTFATPGDVSVVYTTQAGRYTKIGHRVFVDLIIQGGITHTTAAGSLRITGLPFTVASNINGLACAMGGYTKANYDLVMGQAIGSTTYIQIIGGGSAQSLAYLQASDVPTGGSLNINIGGSYLV
jgi:hypothetical protein